MRDRATSSSYRWREKVLGHRDCATAERDVEVFENVVLLHWAKQRIGSVAVGKSQTNYRDLARAIPVSTGTNNTDCVIGVEPSARFADAPSPSHRQMSASESQRGRTSFSMSAVRAAA